MSEKVESTKFIGEEFKTNNSGICYIVEYTSGKEVAVEFEDGFRTTAQMSNIHRGRVRNPCHQNNKLYGFGVTDEKGSSNSSRCKIYRVWESMITRAYSEKYHKKYPSYKNVEVDIRWERFSEFRKSVSNFVGYDEVLNNGWVLDKDILVKGNKTYSPETCCFVPPEINGLVVRTSKRNNLPLGVHFCKRQNLYVSQMSVGNSMKHLGYFDCPDKAHETYLLAKKDHMRFIADNWRGKIDPRVYEALIDWTVEIND